MILDRTPGVDAHGEGRSAVVVGRTAGRHRNGAATTRAEILEQLRLQGFTGAAEVEIEEGPGKRRVEIRLEQHHTGETGSIEPGTHSER